MSEVKYFDIHSHLNFSQFDEDREEIITQMREEGTWTIAVGTGLETSRQAVSLANENEHIFATVGIHPTDWEENFVDEEFEKLIAHTKVVGVGECGLDYYRIEESDSDIKEKQKELFVKHIEFANKHEKPLMIHGRPRAGSMDAYEDMLSILLDSRLMTHESEFSGNIHFFVGDKDIARKFLDMGFTISFDGPITFTRDYDEVVRYVPLERMMAETDAPFAAPNPYRGKRNNPLYVKEIYRSIAEIRGEDAEEVREQLTQNACRFWSIA